ncbi:Cytokine receptor [Araneus ventricosus]|uniref:Cytokine receptor n=1 Tax=Araneus ventricosus TaxID=182803 RepID=A0A4Y2JQQ2_ARAVE|nr:Cytokine receptor [Araneus ventricosus]
MKSVPFLLLAVFILQSCCIHPAESCDIFENPLGSVSPDRDVKVGSPFKFRCTLFPDTVKNHSVTSADLILNFTDRSSPTVTLPPTSIIDEYSVEYSVENASLKDNGIYSCYVPTLTEKTPQLVCMSSVSVGYPPLNATNFNCLSLEYTNLTCTWNEPINNVKTQYILQDLLHDNKFFKRKCPVPIKPSGCQYRLDTKPVYVQSQEYLSFILVGINSLGESKQYFKIKHYEIIKPGVPTFVQFSNVRETSLVINISAPKGLQYREFVEGLIYSIKYYSVSTPLNITKEVLVTTDSGNANLTLQDLVPHTVYDFEVRCHLNIESDKFLWSDSKIATEITKSDVPYFAPVVHSSAFDYQNIAGNRTISVYWQPVPSQFENGEDFVYYIRYHESYVASRFKREASKKSSSYIKVGNKTSATIEHLDPGQAYMFNIVSANKEGKSTNDTAQIVIDKIEKMLPGPRDIFVISYGKGLYNISWKAPDVLFTQYVLFWCENYKLSSTKCDGPLNTVSVTGQTKRELILPDRNSNYQFAVATVHGFQTSGMYWAPCTVVHNMKYKVLKMELIPKTSTSLRVRWSMRCEAEKKVVKEYSIHYCPFSGNCTYNNAKHCEVDGKGPLSWPHVNLNHSSINLSLTEYILDSLTPYTCYAAYMRVRTGAGWGESSDFTYESTMPSAPGDPPGNVHAVVKNASIKVSFDPPTIPNGRITRYVIYYNKTSVDEANYHKEYRVSEDAHGKLPGSIILDNVNYYTNYSIEVTACVDQACSVPSEPIYVTTGISNPGVIIPPRVEVLENNINISWASPLLPNGPVQYYQVWVDGEAWDDSSIYNISGSTFLLLDRKCDAGSNNETQFEVRAVNLKDGNPLFGEFSEPTKTILCPLSSISLKIGIAVGAAVLILFALVGLAYYANMWYKKLAAVKRTKIQLPKGLDSPMDNPLNSYDKFKSGLKNHHDSGIPNDRAYDRLFSSNSDGDLMHTEDKRGPSGRNNSGESAASGKCHTSISSANTTKTHNSMDSGAEVESPLSPDSFSSDSGSINTTPLPFQPDLNIVDESNHLASRDSGLERDNLTTVYVPRVIPRFEEQDGLPKRHLSEEEKERILSALSNSAPSVEDEINHENAISSYAKFGYGRSQSDKNLDGYSKFGEPDASGPNPVAEFRNHQVCPSFVVHGPNRSGSLSLGRSKEDSFLLFKKKAKEHLLHQKKSPGNAHERKLYSVVGEASAPSDPASHYVPADSLPSQRTMPLQSAASAMTAPAREMQQGGEDAARSTDILDPPASSVDSVAYFLDNLNLEDVLPPDFERHLSQNDRSETTDKDSGNGSDQDASCNVKLNMNLMTLTGGGIIEGSLNDLMPSESNGSANDCCTDEFGVPEETRELQNNSPTGYTAKPQQHFAGYVDSATLLPIISARVMPQPNLADISVESV